MHNDKQEIRFDLDAEPPRQESIDLMDADLRIEEKSLGRRLVFLRLSIGIFLLVILLVLVDSVHQELLSGEVSVASFSVSYWKVIHAFSVIGLVVITLLQVKLDETRENVTFKRRQLEPMSSEHAQDVLDIASNHPEIEAYRDAVARQGRTLTAGENTAIQAWARDRETRREDKEHDETMRRLHTPNAS